MAGPQVRNPFNSEVFLEKAPGWRDSFYYLETTTSTNELARQKLRENRGKAGRFLILADLQTAGRGRLGRAWTAPPGSGLLCSLVFPISIFPLELVYLFTGSLALSVVKAVAKLAPGTGLRLKWPNDLVREGKKVGGILAEVENNSGYNKDETWLVLGFGLNTSLTPEEFMAGELDQKASNLTLEPLGREILLAEILLEFSRFQGLIFSDFNKVWEEWKEALITLGRAVKVLNLSGKDEIQGEATGVTREGALIVRDREGKEQLIRAGDVSIRGPGESYI